MNFRNALAFTFVLSSIVAGHYYLKTHEEYRKKLRLYYNESENAREMYTGKIKPVYNPLDKAFSISPRLRELVKNKIEIGQFSQWNVMSLWIDPSDLYDIDKGLFKNSSKGGRLWERAAYLRYYKDQKVQFESYVGVREHGNSSRRMPPERKNFRIYFRDKYGKKVFKEEPHITQKPGAGVKRMVLKRELNINFHNDLSSYILRSLGGVGSTFEHTALFINGKFHGLYTFTEHLSFDQFKRSVGHDRFLFAKLRGNRSIEENLLHENLRFKLEKLPNLDFETVDRLFDLDSAVASLLTMMYTGNGDWYQGVFFKDLTDDQNKWKYIPWDFDASFRSSIFNTYEKAVKNYEVRSVDLAIEKKRGKILWSIFNRLIFDDEKFRDFFSRKVDLLFQIMESEETKEKLQEYRRLASGIDNKLKLNYSIDNLETFIENRNRVLCRDLKKWVDLTPNRCFKESQN